MSNDWISPLEFWQLTPGQVWWVIEAKTPANVLSRSADMDELKKMVREAKESERLAA